MQKSCRVILLLTLINLQNQRAKQFNHVFTLLAGREHLHTRKQMFWNAMLENYHNSESNQKIVLNSLRKEDNVIHQVMYLILK
jgi:hypothetical protein